VATSASPIGVTSNRSKVPICFSGGRAWLEVRIRSLSRISGLEPTMVTVPPRIAVKPIGISRRDIGRPERAEMRLTTGRNRAAAPTFCMNEEMMPTVPEMIGMMRFSVVPPILNHRDDRHHRVGAEAVEQPLVVDQARFQPHQGREQAAQSQQHHDRDGGHVHLDDLEGEQVDGQHQDASHPGDLDTRHDGGQVDRDQGEQSAGNQLLDAEVIEDRRFLRIFRFSGLLCYGFTASAHGISSDTAHRVTRARNPARRFGAGAIYSRQGYKVILNDTDERDGSSPVSASVSAIMHCIGDVFK